MVHQALHPTGRYRARSVPWLGHDSHRRAPYATQRHRHRDCRRLCRCRACPLGERAACPANLVRLSLMSLDYSELTAYVEDHIGAFHAARLRSLEAVTLTEHSQAQKPLPVSRQEHPHRRDAGEDPVRCLSLLARGDHLRRIPGRLGHLHLRPRVWWEEVGRGWRRPRVHARRHPLPRGDQVGAELGQQQPDRAHARQLCHR